MLRYKLYIYSELFAFLSTFSLSAEPVPVHDAQPSGPRNVRSNGRYAPDACVVFNEKWVVLLQRVREKRGPQVYVNEVKELFEEKCCGCGCERKCVHVRVRQCNIVLQKKVISLSNS